MTTQSVPLNAPSPLVYTYQWTFPGDTPIFVDHFPRQPLVPAYLQLARLHDVAVSLIATRATRARVKSVKFLRPIRPDETLDVTCDVSRERGSMKFSIHRLGERVTYGEFVFD